MVDFSIYESGDGGELLMVNNDISLADSLLQLVYISLFGGNTEASTLGNEIESELRYDWWANSLIFGTQPNKQFNSLTEKTLKTTPLSSSGRLEIQRAIEQDLTFLNQVVDIKVEVSIKGSHRVEILVSLNKYKGKENVDLQYLWDNVQNSVIMYKKI